MRSPHQHDLTLLVPSSASQERTWILETQSRNTFKIGQKQPGSASPLF
jgi:hypothetical protein